MYIFDHQGFLLGHVGRDTGGTTTSAAGEGRGRERVRHTGGAEGLSEYHTLHIFVEQNCEVVNHGFPVIKPVPARATRYGSGKRFCILLTQNWCKSLA